MKDFSYNHVPLLLVLLGTTNWRADAFVSPTTSSINHVVVNRSGARRQKATGKISPSFSSTNLYLSDRIADLSASITTGKRSRQPLADEKSSFPNSSSSVTDSLPKTAPNTDFIKGFATIGFITVLNASLAPAWHAVYDSTVAPPPLFLNAAVGLVALLGLLVGGPWLDDAGDAQNFPNRQTWNAQSWKGGLELGFWKGLGTYLHCVCAYFLLCLYFGCCCPGTLCVCVCLLSQTRARFPSLVFLAMTNNRNHVSCLRHGLDDG